MINQKYKLSFEYGNRGYGELILFRNDKIIDVWWSRTGSCNTENKLVNTIDPHLWYLISSPELPHESEYEKMAVLDRHGFGWKQRLWPIPCPAEHDPISHFLIHPDGNLPGTSGCVGIQNSNAIGLFYFFAWYFETHKNTIIGIDIKKAV